MFPVKYDDVIIECGIRKSNRDNPTWYYIVKDSRADITLAHCDTLSDAYKHAAVYINLNAKKRKNRIVVVCPDTILEV